MGSIDGVKCPGDLYLKMTGQFTSAAHGHPSPGPSPRPTPPSPRPSPTPPSPRPRVDTLRLGDQLNAGDGLISASGIARLTMQRSDGNLVLYNKDKAVWSSKTSGHPGAWLVLQGDGNLVIYDSKKKPLWSSGQKRGAAMVMLHDDCNLVIADSKGNTLWS